MDSDSKDREEDNELGSQLLEEGETSSHILKVLQAAVLIRGAWLGIPAVEDDEHDFEKGQTSRSTEEVWSRRARSLVHGRSWLTRCVAGLAWSLAGLSLLERPWWCAGSAKCGNNAKSDYYPNSSISGRITPNVLFFFRGIIWLFALFEVLMGYAVNFAIRKASSRASVSRNTTLWKRMSTEVTVRTLVLICLALDGISAKVIAQSRKWSSRRAATLSPATCFLRALLVLSADRSVRSQLKLVAQGAPELGALLVLLGLCLGAFAWFGTLLWPDDTDQGRAVFNNYESSLWNLLIALTTANFPDVMQRSYDASRISVLFFLAFIIIGLYILLNLVLAIVADAYARSLAERQRSALLIRQYNLQKAFTLLTTESQGGVRQITFLHFIHELGQLPSTPSLDPTQARILFAILDDDGQGVIDFVAFESRLMDALRLRFAKVRDEHSVAAARRALSAVVLSKRFEIVVSIIILANLVFEAIVEHKALAGNDDEAHAKSTDGQPDTLAQIIATCFTAFYTIEVTAKAIAKGGLLRLCQTSAADCFDVISTVTALAATAWVFYPNSFNNADAIRYALLLRTLRLVRFITLLPIFKRTTKSLAVVLPRALELLKTSTFVGFVFAALGLVLFGGRITTDPDNKHAQQIIRHAPDFATEADVGYYANSMNDVGSAMITLFELMIVNNWFLIASGYIATTSKLHRFYFVLYWIIQVLGFVNLLVATILDTFITEWDDAITQSQPNETEARENTSATTLRRRRRRSSNEDHLIFDASRITGTDTGLPHHVYSVVIDQSSSPLHADHLDRAHRRSLLRLLLTPNSVERQESLPPSTS